MFKIHYQGTIRMEKNTPHCKLIKVKELIFEGKVRLTATASAGGHELGLNDADVISIVSQLTSKDFYKSMTTYADNRIWQDVAYSGERDRRFW